MWWMKRSRYRFISRAFAAILGHPPQRAVGVVLLKPVELVEHRGVLHLERRDRAHQIPQALHVVRLLSVAADHKTPRGVHDAVQCAAGELGRLEDGDTAAV